MAEEKDEGLAAIALPDGNGGAPWSIAACSGVGTNHRDSLRLYQMWLAGALEQPGGPELDQHWDNWRVSSFWICATLMMHLSLPVSNQSLEDTRVTLLLRVFLFVSGAHLRTNEHNFMQTLGEMQEAVPEASPEVCAELLVTFMADPHLVTPELSDEAFERILEATPERDIRRYAEQVAVDVRAFRFKRFNVDTASEGPAPFLASLPPPPRVCLNERSMSGAAYLSERPMDERFAHIFRYASTTWKS